MSTIFINIVESGYEIQEFGTNTNGNSEKCPLLQIFEILKYFYEIFIIKKGLFLNCLCKLIILKEIESKSKFKKLVRTIN